MMDHYHDLSMVKQGRDYAGLYSRRPVIKRKWTADNFGIKTDGAMLVTRARPFDGSIPIIYTLSDWGHSIVEVPPYTGKRGGPICTGAKWAAITDALSDWLKGKYKWYPLIERTIHVAIIPTNDKP